MLFHAFPSQEERRTYGGSDFMELQRCRQKQGTKLEELVSAKSIEHWKNDSLYICGDDLTAFYEAYAAVFSNGYYGNGKQGLVDCCGINYYTPAQTKGLAARLKIEKPRDYQVLLNWLEDAEPYNGIYLLGL